MTVRWHVDDLMISHTSSEAISQFLRALKDIYGDNLAETTGSVHDYLATQEDAILSYHASDMVLAVHSDASYLSEWQLYDGAPPPPILLL